MPPVPPTQFGQIITLAPTTSGGDITPAKPPAEKDAKDAAPGCDRSLKLSGDGPCAVYFCSEQLAVTAGLGTLAIRAKTKAGVKPLQDTIFESNSVLNAFKKAGIKEFFKVPATKENVGLAKKYNVRMDNTLVLCSPSGEVVTSLAGPECNQTNTIKLLKAWPEIYAAWQQKKASR